MVVAKDVIVTLIFDVKIDEEDVVVDQVTEDHPLTYLHGNDYFIPGLEKALAGLKPGDDFDVKVAPQDAYGDYNDHLVQRVPSAIIGGVENIEVGDRFIADTDMGQIPVEVTAIDGDFVIVDGNHLLAGKTLCFTGKVLATRPATEEEIAHGHAHGEGGCGHHHEEGCCEHDHDHHHHHEAQGCCDDKDACCDDKEACCSEGKECCKNGEKGSCKGKKKEGACCSKKKKKEKSCCGGGGCHTH